MDPVSRPLSRNITIIPPEGWTIDEEEIDCDYNWGSPDSDGQSMAKSHGLKKPAQPIMCTTRDTGACICMFQSGSKYYLWNMNACMVLKIVTSLDLADIVTEMGKKGLGSLKTVELHIRLPADLGGGK